MVWFNPLNILIRWRTHEVDERLKERETPAEPWRGLAEAEFTDEQEREAQRRAGNEWRRHRE